MRGRFALSTALLAATLAAGPAAAPLFAAEASPQELVEPARRALDRKDHREAERLASRVVADHPKSPAAVEAWLVLVDSLTDRNSLPRAAQECEKLLAAYPDAPQRGAILSRELDIGKALTQDKVKVLFVKVPRTQEGVDTLEKVVEHAPYGPLADDAVLAMADARFRDGDYELARDQYDRLLKNYPESDLAPKARVGRALCNYRLTQGAAYDPTPAEEAALDMARLAREPGHEDLAKRVAEMRDVRARGEYEAGLFYFGQHKIEAGLLYMGAVIARYPDSPYAGRARRILEAVAGRYPDTTCGERAKRVLASVQAGEFEELFKEAP